MTVRVEAVTSRSDLRDFQLVPWMVYRGVSQWVPPLLTEERKLLDPAKGHPFHEHADTALFLARRNRDITGRIAACVNHRHNEFHDDRIGFFGFFETLDDQETADGLLDVAGEWLSNRGMSDMRGPASYSVNETCALLVEGFDSPPVILMSYNPAYYVDLLEKAGFASVQEMVAYRIHEAEIGRRDDLATFAARMKERRGIQVRTADLKNLKAELGPVRRIYNEAWAENWGAVPMTTAEIEHLAKSLKPLLKDGLALIAEVDGDAIGFALSVPDINRAIHGVNGRLLPFGIFKLLWEERKIDSVRTLALGIIPEYRRKGVDAVLLDEMIRGATSAGYYSSEMGWVLEGNQAMRQPLERLGAEIVKRYRFYERPL
ncbi:MAG: GNAT family N-acetyltransferase [Acidimicrobiia bacterium]